MRKLVAVTFVTLDGIMQGPGGPGEDDTNGFHSGGWSVNYWDQVVADVMTDEFAKKPDLLLGRKTYDIFAGFWPNAKPEDGADDLNNAKKYVVTRTLDKVDWQNSFLVKGDVVKAIQKLKEMNGPELQVHGSSDLMQTLLKHGLLDELHLKIFPVAIGKGKRFFGEDIHPSGFKLLSSSVSSMGVIVANYAYDGALKTGTFGE